MASKRKRKKMPKDRNVVVVMMILTRKGGPHKDKKHNAKKNGCRGRVVLDEND